MVELELDSLHADGENLILRGPDGQRYRLVIDEALRTAVRRDRPHLEALRAREASALRPRDIQSRIRAGASVEEVAAEGGLTLESVRRYEGPVQAERSWIAQQTRALPIGREVGAPTLGDLVVDRLAARGVTSEAEWDAVRRAGEPWEVAVAFTAGGSLRVAHWQVDLTTRSLVALDDESRWLSETELTGSRRAARGRPFDVEHEDDSRRAPDVVILDSRALPTEGDGDGRDESSGTDRVAVATDGSPTSTVKDGAAPAATDHHAPAEEDRLGTPAATEALLDRLDATRGRRGFGRRRPARGDDAVQGSAPPSASTDDQGDDGDPTDDATPARTGGSSGTASRTSAVDDALFPVAPVLRLRQQVAAPVASAGEPGSQDDAHDGVDPVDDGAPAAATEDDAPAASGRPARSRAKARRTSIPSWDEIVFGAKQD